MQRAKLFDPIPSPLRIGALIGASALAGWSWWFWVGPAAWLGDLQVALFGAYIPVLTLLLVWVVLVFVLLLPLRVVFREVSDPDALRQREAREARWLEIVQLKRTRALLIGLGLGVAGLGVGGTGLVAGTLQPRTVAELAAGDPARYVQVPVDDARFEGAVYIDDTLRDWYIPLGPPPWSVFVQLTAGEHVDPSERLTEGRGLVWFTGLPADLHGLYAPGQLAEHTVVIDLGDDPSDRIGFGLVLVVLGAIGVLLAGLGHAWVVRARSRASDPAR